MRPASLPDEERKIRERCDFRVGCKILWITPIGSQVSQEVMGMKREWILRKALKPMC